MAERTSLAFEVDGERLLGLLHHPAAGKDRGVGLVICGGFAGERVDCHRLQWLAAERLAAAGFSVMRFDYRGTGVSEGAFAESTMGRNIADVLGAVAHLGRQPGLERAPIGLVALSQGADYALCAAAEMATGMAAAPVLLLWSPVLTVRDPAAAAAGAPVGHFERPERDPDTGRPMWNIDTMWVGSAYFRDRGGRDSLPRLEAFRGRLMTVFGGDDTEVLEAPFLEPLSRKGECRFIAGSDHLFSHSRHTAALVDLSLEWLDSLFPDGRSPRPCRPEERPGPGGGPSEETLAGEARPAWRDQRVIELGGGHTVLVVHHAGKRDRPAEMEDRPAARQDPPAASAGRLVLLVHNWGSHKAGRTYLLTGLARSMAEAGFEVAHFDCRGCGESDGDLEEVTLATMAADIEEVARHCRKAGSGPAEAIVGRGAEAIVGFGAGANAALAAAAGRAGEAASGPAASTGLVVLISPILKPCPPPVQWLEAASLACLRNEGCLELSEVLGIKGEPGKEWPFPPATEAAAVFRRLHCYPEMLCGQKAGLEFLEEWSRLDITGDFDRFPGDVVFILGERDPALGLAREMAWRYSPRVHLRTVPGATPVFAHALLRRALFRQVGLALGRERRA
jgi:hypothetical protein